MEMEIPEKKRLLKKNISLVRRFEEFAVEPKGTVAASPPVQRDKSEKRKLVEASQR